MKKKKKTNIKYKRYESLKTGPCVKKIKCEVSHGESEPPWGLTNQSTGIFNDFFSFPS